MVKTKFSTHTETMGTAEVRGRWLCLSDAQRETLAQADAIGASVVVGILVTPFGGFIQSLGVVG